MKRIVSVATVRSLARDRPPSPVERADDVLDELLGRGGAGGQADPKRAGEQLGRGCPRRARSSAARTAGTLGDLDEAARVRRVLRADDENEVTLARQGPDGVLAVLGRVADVVGGGPGQQREALAQAFDDAVGLIDGQRRLREVGDSPRVVDLDVRDLLVLTRSPGRARAPRRRCPRPPRGPRGRQDDVEVVAGKAPRFRRGPLPRADRSRRSRRARARGPRRGPPVRRRGRRRSRSRRAGTSSTSSTNTAPRASSSLDDVDVVHDLLAHVDRSAALLASAPLDDLDGAHRRPRTMRAGRRGRRRGGRAARPTPRAGRAARRSERYARALPEAARAGRYNSWRVRCRARRVGSTSGHAGPRRRSTRTPCQPRAPRARELAPRARRERAACEQRSGRYGRAGRHGAGRRRGSPGRGIERSVRGAQLAREHDVARLERVVQRAREAGDHDRAGGVLGKPRSGARASRGPTPNCSTRAHGAPERIARASTPIGVSTTGYACAVRSEHGAHRVQRRQRHDRKNEPVEVVVDVEVRREAGARVLRLIPAAVGALRVDEKEQAAAQPRRSARPPRAARSAPRRSATRCSAPRPTHSRST